MSDLAEPSNFHTALWMDPFSGRLIWWVLVAGGRGIVSLSGSPHQLGQRQLGTDWCHAMVCSSCNGGGSFAPTTSGPGPWFIPTCE